MIPSRVRMSAQDPRDANANAKRLRELATAKRARARKSAPNFTPAIKLDFLSWLRRGYSVTKACDQVGCTPRQAYTHRNAFTEFAEQWDDALEEGADKLEDVAVKRAIDGVERPIYQQGIKVGTETVYNENLLMFLLKGKKPEKYRERHDLTSGGNDITQSFAKALIELPKYANNKHKTPADED